MHVFPLLNRPGLIQPVLSVYINVQHVLCNVIERICNYRDDFGVLKKALFAFLHNMYIHTYTLGVIDYAHPH